MPRLKKAINIFLFLFLLLSLVNYSSDAVSGQDTCTVSPAGSKIPETRYDHTSIRQIDPFAVRVKDAVSDYLNVRTGPGNSYDIITQIYAGQKFISDYYENGWYRIDIPSGSGISYGWSYGGTSTENGYLEGSQETSYVRVIEWKGTLNVRTGPGTSYGIITSISSGQRFAAVEESGGWYKIFLLNIDDYSFGWASGNYLELFEGGDNEGYKADLLSLDCPSSLQAGNSGTVSMEILNSGSNSFNENTILACTVPRFRSSAFFYSTWISDSRVMASDRNCLPGQAIIFSFTIKAPDDGANNSYTEYFNLYQDGFNWFSDMGGPDDSGIYFTINVTGSQAYGPKREIRAVWISTVYNIDWPKQRALGDSSEIIPAGEYMRADWPGPAKDTAGQQASLIAILDELMSTGINTVFLQVRPACDAFYQSNYEPWSRYLTGTEGEAPDPFWDPLEFAIDACHERGMELHAWINPYRARAGGTSNHPTHVINTHPEWIVTYGASSKKVLNPGLPEVRAHVENVIMDIVTGYNVDGIHFDDYFYPYPESGYSFDDSEAYGLYGNGMSLEDWRRYNVNTLIETVYNSIKTIDQRVKFGVSPFGIWKSGTPPGIAGLSAYDDIFCDALAWLSGNYVDYISPQLYWGYGGSTDYALLMPWWALQAGNNNRHFYPGLAAYRVASGQLTAETLRQQILDSRDNSLCQGTIFFSSSSVTDYTVVNDPLKNELYLSPALVPAMEWIDAIPPRKPLNLTITPSGDGNIISWGKPQAASDGEYPSRYILYCSLTEEIDTDNAGNILYITGISEEPDLSYFHQTSSTCFYAAASLDRTGNESPAAYVSQTIDNPSDFSASSAGPDSIGLTWNENSSGDNVMIAYNTVDIFGIPEGGYSVGEIIDQGGTVIFRGSAASFVHAGLEAGSIYYYKIWSYNADNLYSDGLTSYAVTEDETYYSLTLYSYPQNNDVLLYGAGSYMQGDIIGIEAINPGYEFFSWTGEPDDVLLLDDQSSASTFFTMPGRDIILTASFIEENSMGMAVMSLANPLHKGTYIWSYAPARQYGHGYKGSDWQNISSLSASRLIAGDIDTIPGPEIISIFDEYGLWYYSLTENLWVNIMGSSVPCRGIALAMAGGTSSCLIASFDNYGIYKRETDGQWIRLTYITAGNLIAVNFDKDTEGRDELIFTAEGYNGLFLYDLEYNSIARIEMAAPVQMHAADITGDGFKDLVCAFESAGIYLGSYAGSKSDFNRTVADCHASGKTLQCCFDSPGIFPVLKSVAWNRITSAIPMDGHNMGSADIAGSPGEEIFIAYGDRTYYYCIDSGSWFTFVTAPFDWIVSGRFTGGYYDDIIAQASPNGNIYLYKKVSDSWELIAASGNLSSLASF